MEDNSALIFHPNKYVHWRPIKEFLPGESVTMIFFRFKDVSKKNDYSHLDYTVGHEIFKEIDNIRNNYKD